MVAEKKRSINFGSDGNESRRKRGAKETEEKIDQSKTTKRQKLDRDLKQKQPETSQRSSSESFYVSEKVSRSAKPAEEHQRESDQYSKEFLVPTPLSHEKALRAATIKIRFADTIVKARYRKLFDESCNKADVMTKIEKERKVWETRQREEKARIEAEIRAPRLKLRHEKRLAIKKIDEEARSNVGQDAIVAEKEIMNLCGGSTLAGTRWVEQFGLFLKSDDDGLTESEKQDCDRWSRGEK